MPETLPLPINPLERILTQQAIEFPLGIPGFNDHHHFVLNQKPGEKPFAWLRSKSDFPLAFAVCEAFHLVPDYQFEIDDSQLEVIGSPAPGDYAVLFILRLQPGTPFTIYANLRAPLLINMRTRQGRQIMLMGDVPYSESTAFQF